MPSSITLNYVGHKANEMCKLSVKQVKYKYTNVPNGGATYLCLDLSKSVVYTQGLHHHQHDKKTKLVFFCSIFSLLCSCHISSKRNWVSVLSLSSFVGPTNVIGNGVTPFLSFFWPSLHLHPSCSPLPSPPFSSTRSTYWSASAQSRTHSHHVQTYAQRPRRAAPIHERRIWRYGFSTVSLC